MEKEAKKRKRKRDIQFALLSTIKALGVIGLIITAPNSLKMLSKFGIYINKPTQVIKRSLYTLQKRGHIAYENNRYVLTKKGKDRLSKEILNEFNLGKAKKWDGMWRILVFDVPERYRKNRDHLRLLLKTKGFVLLQRSVWVYPFDCEDFVSLIKVEYKLHHSLLYIIADTIEHDEQLRSFFGV